MSDHDELMAELEAIINGGAKDLDRDADAEMRQALVRMVNDVSEEGLSDGVHLFSVVEQTASEAFERGATTVDGKSPTPDEVARGNYTAVRIERVYHFESPEDASEMMTDPQTQLAYEGTMPNSGCLAVYKWKGEQVDALFIPQRLVVRKHLANGETVTFSVKPRQQDPDEFFSPIGLSERAKATVQNLVAFRNTPIMLRADYPRLFAKMYEQWKEKMRQQEGDSE